MTKPAAAEKKKILVVEDHPLFRAMLVQLINGESDMTVCGETDNINDAVSVIVNTQPDAAIVDISLNGSSGLELVKQVKAKNIRLPVLVLSMHPENLYVERALRAGAKGYISKLASTTEVLTAIGKVLGGGIYISEQATAEVLERIAQSGMTTQTSGMDILSDRELEVFQFVGQGMNSHEIAERTNLGVSTVDSYKSRIKEKLGIKNAAALSQRAAQWVAENEL